MSYVIAAPESVQVAASGLAPSSRHLMTSYTLEVS
jgi:hypothetical protein